ncbi:MAG: PleD family two-component system response regulator [Phycisphaerae bacterium]
MSTESMILVVDDNPTNIAVLAEMLSAEYELKTALSGEEALDMVKDFTPDVILLDIMMPGIDGYEVCRRLRADPTYRHTKIIMVSAKALLAERLEGYDAGADDYITKPFDEDELVAKVRVYLRLKYAGEEESPQTGLLSKFSEEPSAQFRGILLPTTILMSDDSMVAIERKMLAEMVYRNVKRLQLVLEEAIDSKDSGGELAEAAK